MELSDLGRGTANIWTRAQALTVLSSDQVRSQLYDGCWVAPLPGICTDAGVALDPVQWGFVAVLASKGSLAARQEDEPVSALRAVACGRTAARIWELPLIDDDDPATGALDRHAHDVAVWRHLEPVRSRPFGPEDPVDVLHRHQLRLGRSDLQQLPCGLWLTTLLRTLFDLTPLVSPEALVCALDAALHCRQVTRADLERFAAEHAGWPTTARFLAAVELSDAGAESPCETLTRLLLRPSLPGLRSQVQLLDRFGRVLARFDLGDEELKLAVESDGRKAHSGEVMRAKDTRRDSTAEEHGWLTERVTWFQVRCRPEATRQRVVQAAAKRRSA
jgi:very-short-patch-repair endonuclease